MLAPAPQSVQQAWGEVVTRDVTGWLEDSMADQTVHRDEWREVVTRLDGADKRFDGIDTRFDGVDVRFDRIETHLAGMDTHLSGMDTRLTGVETLLTGMDTRLAVVEHDLSLFRGDMRDFRSEMNVRLDRLQQQLTAQNRMTLSTLAFCCTLVVMMLAITQLNP
jgi:hypothetical protein